MPATLNITAILALVMLLLVGCGDSDDNTAITVLDASDGASTSSGTCTEDSDCPRVSCFCSSGTKGLQRCDAGVCAGRTECFQGANAICEPAPAPRAVGEACNNNDDCDSRRCLINREDIVGYCTQACTSNADCLVNWVCDPEVRGDAFGNWCLRL